MSQQTVCVVDDEAGVRRSLGRLLRIAGFEVDEFGSADEFLAKAGERCGCVVLDFSMPGLSGLELQDRLAESGSDWQVVFFTGRADVSQSVRAMKAGAVDFLVKPANREQILEAVHKALARHSQAQAARMQRRDLDRRLADLSPREREVMGHVIAGERNKQIADALGTAEKTVKIQRANLMRKMGVTSVAELVRLTERAGIAPIVTAR